MKQLFSMLLVLNTCIQCLQAQSVGIGTNAPHPSAVLELSSNNKGLLLPSMASSERTAIISPAFGLLVYDLNTKSIWMYSTGGWTELVTVGTNLWQQTGANVWRTAGNVGIGIENPFNRLQVHNSLGATNYLRITNNTSGPLATDGLQLGGTGANASLLNVESGALVLGTNNDSVIFMTAASGPRVGIGEPSPVTALDIRNTATGNIARFNGGSQTYASIFENGTYRGYWGSYSGNPEDVDFGTGFFTNGSLHLTIGTFPQLTISPIGNVGIGTTTPVSGAKLHVRGDSIRTALFTSSHTNASDAAVIRTETVGGIDNQNAIGIHVIQNAIEGRGRGLLLEAGYIGAEVYSRNVNFATQNFGIISTATCDNDAWGVYAVANGAGVVGQRIGVYGSASGGATRWAFYGNGNAFLSGGTWQTSDERFKKEIVPLANAALQLLKLKPSQYLFDTNSSSYLQLPEGRQHGFLASNVMEVFPEMVKKVTAYKDRPLAGSANESIEFNAVNYTALIPVLTQAINEHTEEIKQLRLLVEELLRKQK
jgi:hypothetical protein